jgi:hypothetical protein
MCFFYVYKLHVLTSHKWIPFCYIQQKLKIVCKNIFQIQEKLLLW